jgi:hypothetical protein
MRLTIDKEWPAFVLSGVLAREDWIQQLII